SWRGLYGRTASRTPAARPPPSITAELQAISPQDLLAAAGKPLAVGDAVMNTNPQTNQDQVKENAMFRTLTTIAKIAALTAALATTVAVARPKDGHRPPRVPGPEPTPPPIIVVAGGNHQIRLAPNRPGSGP